MYETIRIVTKLKPKYVIWENVKNLLSKKHRHNFDNYLDKMSELGYTNYYQVLNAKDYGIPQNRERVFTISIRKDIDTGYTFPEKQELKLRLKDMLEEEVEEKYYLSDKLKIYYQHKIEQGWKKEITTDSNSVCNTILNCGRNNIDNTFVDTLYIKNNTKKGYLEAHEGDGVYTNVSTKRGTVSKQISHTLTKFQDYGVVIKSAYTRDYGSKAKLQAENICDTLQAAMGEGGGNIPVVPHLRIRKLTPKECWRLMGFNDEEFEKAQAVNSNAQLYKQAGNSIVVNVLEKILENLLEG